MIARSSAPVRFRARCGELAGPKETARRRQGERYGDPALHGAEPLEGCCAAGQPPAQRVIVLPRKLFDARQSQ
jgi:hypothetical protein